MTPIEREALSDARRVDDYEAGWNNCAIWAGREDLLSDTDSPAYLKERDAFLAASIGDRARIRAEALEEAAKTCDSEAKRMTRFINDGTWGGYCDTGAMVCAAAIRALVLPATGQKT